MARGKEGKLRRRQNRQNDKEDENEAKKFLDGEEEDDWMPLPPKMKAAAAKQRVLVETVDSDDDEVDDNMPKKKNKKITKSKPVAVPVKKKEGIKTLPLILLCCLMGTTLLPLLIYAGDYFAANNVLGQVGFRLGIGSVPRRRVLSFYEKHAPEKLEQVPTILANNYGKYPELVKKLERKYHDYGYFLDWERDEAPMTLALETVRSLYDQWVTEYWNRHAPQQLKTAFRNIRYNLTNLYKKAYKIWKKKIWPVLEPVFGEFSRVCVLPWEVWRVPALFVQLTQHLCVSLSLSFSPGVPKGTEKQKRQDAAEARARAKAGSGKKTRRRSQEFRDDEDEQ
jgi:hypothetical protein